MEPVRGQMELAKLMIQKGANDLDLGLIGACLGGHLELTKLMIQLRATRCHWCGDINRHR